MFTYHKFLIKDSDRFIATTFPQLEASLEEVAEKLEKTASGPAAEMIIDYTRDKNISAQHETDHPGLTDLITSGNLPLQVIKDLFESSQDNTLFKEGLETYIKAFLKSGVVV